MIRTCKCGGDGFNDAGDRCVLCQGRGYVFRSEEDLYDDRFGCDDEEDDNVIPYKMSEAQKEIYEHFKKIISAEHKVKNEDETQDEELDGEVV